jgi:regulator of cell morphogenesis and NO signaling
MARAEVFERWGIDYCCGGGTPLETACTRKGLPLPRVLTDLAQTDCHGSETDEQDWAHATMTELADHIVQTHHAYLERELPRLSALAQKVADAHGSRHPELFQVNELFGRLAEQMQVHSRKEEMILFPYCRQLESPDGAVPPPFGTVRNPIFVMEADHDEAGNILDRLRALTNGYKAPVDACNSFKSLMYGLETLEKDLHIHIHKENNILFPRAIELEASLTIAH